MKQMKLPRLGLYVSEYLTSHGTYRIKASIVTIGPTSFSPDLTAQAVRNAGDMERGLFLKDLEAHAFGYENTAKERSISYSDPLNYRDVFSVNRREAEAMARTLGLIERRLRKQYEQNGQPASFGAWLARFGQAIGADAMVFNQDRISPKSSSYDEQQLLIMPLGHGVEQADYYGRHWIETGKAVAA